MFINKLKKDQEYEELEQIRNLWESLFVFVCILFFIHCNVLSDTQDYKLQSLRLTLSIALDTSNKFLDYKF